MGLISKVLLGALLAGGAAQAAPVHVMSVVLPDGEVAQLRYSGDVPPVLVAVPAQAAVAPDPMLAALAQMSAMMGREAAAMLREAAALDAGMAPEGGAGACVQTTEISFGTGMAQPRVVSRSWGACGRPGLRARQLRAPAAHDPVRTVLARDTHGAVVRDGVYYTPVR